MTPKLKQCAACGEDKVIWKNHEGEKYCKDCWYKKAPVKFPAKKLINKKSEKRQVSDQLYSKLRKLFLERYPYCQAKLDGCLTHSTDVHHKSGRDDNYLNQDTWLSVCRTCHQWIELNPIKAKEMGFSTSRLTNENT